MATHRDLEVWRRAHALTVQIYGLTEGRARQRAPHVVSQLRRAIGSIPANIAEGRDQPTKPQFRRYLAMAIGSANEADSHVALLLDLKLLDAQSGCDVLDELAVIRRMLLALQKSV